ncbi:MAG: acyltransferase family protein, partial [Maricaulaceae bacterium]
DVLLSNRVMGWLGRLSYTIYLVHWPLMVFYFILITTKPSLPHIATLIVGSVFLGWVLHIVIERPFRGKAYNGWSSSSNVSYLA